MPSPDVTRAPGVKPTISCSVCRWSRHEHVPVGAGVEAGRTRPARRSRRSAVPGRTGRWPWTRRRRQLDPVVSVPTLRTIPGVAASRASAAAASGGAGRGRMSTWAREVSCPVGLVNSSSTPANSICRAIAPATATAMPLTSAGRRAAVQLQPADRQLPGDRAAAQPAHDRLDQPGQQRRRCRSAAAPRRRPPAQVDASPWRPACADQRVEQAETGHRQQQPPPQPAPGRAAAPASRRAAR